LPRPVKDVELRATTSVAGLVAQFGTSGGFTARKLAQASEIFRGMLRDRRCVKFLAFTADIVATGTRGVIRQMVEQGMCDVIVTTCGTVDHDLARCFAPYHHGSFEMDDAKLRKQGINRLGNVLVPDSSYGTLIEKRTHGLLKEILAEEPLRSRDSKARVEFSTRDLLTQIGRRLPKGSILRACADRGVPVFVPGITDGSFGSQLWSYRHRDPRFGIDVLKDEDQLANLVFDVQRDKKRTGALIVGGGIAKHHTIWWNQFIGGLQYAVYLTTAVEHDGSLSGARMREAVSWGKVAPRAKYLTVEGDATVTLPLLVCAAMKK
jgi:deoxyhypusine synthase